MEKPDKLFFRLFILIFPSVLGFALFEAIFTAKLDADDWAFIHFMGNPLVIVLSIPTLIICLAIYTCVCFYSVVYLASDGAMNMP